MAIQGPADVKKAGWQFYVPVCLGIAAGFFLIVLAEALGMARVISQGFKEACFILGGILMGLASLCLDDLVRTRPAIQRLEEEAAAERAQHQEERRLDFEEYRALQSELRLAREEVSSLRAKMAFAAALDRDYVGDALLLGFYFHKRAERLPSNPSRSIFKAAATRLKVVRDPKCDVLLDKDGLHGVLDIAYGPVVSDAFDLGYLLSHLGEEGAAATASPDIPSDLEQHLKALKLGAAMRTRNGAPHDVSGLLRRFAQRIVSIVRPR